MSREKRQQHLKCSQVLHCYSLMGLKSLYRKSVRTWKRDLLLLYVELIIYGILVIYATLYIISEYNEFE
jgi:hypothetical protein